MAEETRSANGFEKESSEQGADTDAPVNVVDADTPVERRRLRIDPELLGYGGSGGGEEEEEE